MVAAADTQKKFLEDKQNAFVLWFEDVGMSDVSLVGGKNASLGEMIQQLAPKGINVPGGFATTAYAYRYFVEQAGLESKLRQLFADLDVEDLANLRSRGKQARALILNTPFPVELESSIVQAYSQLCQRYSLDTEACDLRVGETAICERFEGEAKELCEKYCYSEFFKTDLPVDNLIQRDYTVPHRPAARNQPPTS